MAKVQMKMPEDFLMKVSRLADKTDEIIPKVLEAGAEVVEDKVRSNLQSVIGSGTKYDSKSTGGAFYAPLALLPPLQDRNGDFDIKVGFSEPRSDGDSNAKIATILGIRQKRSACKAVSEARPVSVQKRLYQRHEGKSWTRR